MIKALGVEEFSFCPLECGARIKDLQKHIQRCRHKGELMVKYLICHNNSSHIIKKEDFDEHLLICDSKANDNLLNDSLELFNSDNSADYVNNDKPEDEEKRSHLLPKIVNDSETKTVLKSKGVLFEKEEDIDKDSRDFYNMTYI